MSHTKGECFKLLYKGRHSEIKESVNIYETEEGIYAIPERDTMETFLSQRGKCVLPDYPKPGQRFRHFKGKDYEVLCLALWGNTDEVVVVYRALYGEGQIWIRPFEMFLGQKEVNGKLINRFTLIQ